MAPNRPLTVGMVAPPWITVPSPSRDGLGLVIDALARGLVARGHQVRLFTVGSSTCPVGREWVLSEPAERNGDDVTALIHALAALDALSGCDVVHDHTLAGAALAAAGWDGPPVVTTIHGSFDDGLTALYRRISQRVPLIAVSADQAARAPEGVAVATVIPHGVDPDAYPARPSRRGSGGYVLCLGRMRPGDGIDVAINAARAAGRRLVIAAGCRRAGDYLYHHQIIEPLLDDRVTCIGEVDHARSIQLLRGADALVHPVQWPEPSGLTMIEALACGTPVVATPTGAASEIVTHGVNGYLAATVDDLAAALDAACRGAIDRRRCRLHAVNHHSMQATAREHEQFYRHAIADHSAGRITSRRA